MKKLSTLCIVFSLFGLIAVFIAANRPSPSQKSGVRKVFGSRYGAGMYGSSGAIFTTVNKSLYPSPNAFGFGTISMSYTSSCESLLDEIGLASGGTSSVMTAAGSGTQQIFYAYSSALDGTLNVFNNTSGTGAAAATVSLTAGQPYEWDTGSGTTAMMLSGTNSINFVAGTTAGGLVTSTTATTVNAAVLYP